MAEPLCPVCGNHRLDFRFGPFLGFPIPPPKPGVYALRIAARGTPPDELVESVMATFVNYAWTAFLPDNVYPFRRLTGIERCDLLYIGATGSLKQRFEQLAWSHPIRVPLAALIYLGWKVEYGYVETEDHLATEDALDKDYVARHGKHPPLSGKNKV